MIARSSLKDAIPIVLDTPFAPTSEIYVGSSGTLQVVFSSGKTVQFTNVPAGWFPIEAVSIASAGTTATGLVAGYY